MHSLSVALKVSLYDNVVIGNYDNAVILSKSFVIVRAGDVIKETVDKLITTVPRNVMTYAYKLWHGDAKDIVRNHFPKPFQHIINEDAVVIVNKIYNQALKLEWDLNSKNNDRAIWGDQRLSRTSDRLSWKFLPTFNRDKLTFLLNNVHRDVYMRMDNDVDYAGDRQCWGATMTEENSINDRFKYYLEPVIAGNGGVVFIIINVYHEQGLKLEVKKDSAGDRLLWGHNGNIRDRNDRFRWIVQPWSSRSN